MFPGKGDKRDSSKKDGGEMFVVVFSDTRFRHMRGVSHVWHVPRDSRQLIDGQSRFSEDRMFVAMLFFDRFLLLPFLIPIPIFKQRGRLLCPGTHAIENTHLSTLIRLLIPMARII